LTLIDAKAAKLMETYALTLSDVLVGNHKLSTRLAQRDIPPTLFERTAAGKSTLEETWLHIITETAAFDATLEPTARNALASSLKRFDWMEKKILKAAQRKNVVLRDRLQRINDSLYPHAGLQERTLGLAPFLARYGKSVIDAVYGALDPFAPEHRGVRLPS
jgi:uncharacterized protein YllA (UPF0747 family)